MVIEMSPSLGIDENLFILGDLDWQPHCQWGATLHATPPHGAEAPEAKWYIDQGPRLCGCPRRAYLFCDICKKTIEHHASQGLDGFCPYCHALSGPWVILRMEPL